MSRLPSLTAWFVPDGDAFRVSLEPVEGVFSRELTPSEAGFVRARPWTELWVRWVDR